MSQNPETFSLYRQLRAAKLTGNHVQALSLLQQIVARDPQDQEAASQLAAYAKPVTKTTGEDDARTRGLFHKLRAACLTQNDPEAFDLLKQILAITPQNAQARQQKKEIGERLSAICAEDLDSLLLAGDETAIYDRVTQLREYADDDYLSRYDSYAAAARIADSVHERLMRGKLDEMVEKLKAISELEERREKAIAIARFASDNQVALSQPEKALISDIEETWKAEQYRLQLLQAVAETDMQLEQAISSFGTASPAETILMMEQIRNRAIELAEIPEGEELLKKAEKTFHKMCSAYKGAEMRRKAARCARGILSFLVLAFVCMTVYAAVTVKKKTASLAAYRADNNPVAIQKELEINRVLIAFYTRMSTGYATEYDACQKYLREWRKERASINQLLGQLRAYMGKISGENILQVADLWMKASNLKESLAEQYGYKISGTQEDELNNLLAEMMDQRDIILQTYLKPQNYTDLREVAERLQAFLNLKPVFPYEEDEVNSVVNQFKEDITRMFTAICSLKPDKVEEWLRDYDATLAPYEKLLLLRSGFDDVKRAREELNALPVRLADCKTLEAYISQLNKSASHLKSIGGLGNLDELSTWAQKADTYAQQEQLKSFLAAIRASHPHVSQRLFLRNGSADEYRGFT